MAEGLEHQSEIVRAVDDRAAEAPLRSPMSISRRSTRGRNSLPHSNRFLFVTVTLFVIAVAAVTVALVVLLGHRSQASSVQWSAWSPPDSGLAGERDIANEVSPYYRASPASQLTVVTVKNVSNSQTSSELALRDPTNGTLQAISGTSAIYTLCGLGPNCAIEPGVPSQARLLLLRREALELALYTFRYIGNVDNVVAILPPGRTQPTAQLTSKPPAPGKTATSQPVDFAVVFQRAGLQHFVSQPLRATLPEPVPPTIAQMSSAPEAELVSVLTSQAMFTQQLVQSQDGSNVLVLTPAPAQ